MGITIKKVVVMGGILYVSQWVAGAAMQFFGLNSMQGVVGTALATLATSLPALYLWTRWGEEIAD